MVRCGVSTGALVARATAKGYEPGAHREKDAVGKKTSYGEQALKNHRSLLNFYDRWVYVVTKMAMGNSHITIPPRIREGLPPLDPATIIDFFRFFARIMCTNAEFFFASFARATGNSIPDEDKSAVYDCVKHEFLQETLITNEKKQKQLWAKDEDIQFQRTYWRCDDSVFGHPRNKIQIAWLISVFCWTGARKGALFAGKGKGGLRYRDIKVVLKRVAGGGWKIHVMYKIDQRWVKNNRDPEFTAYDASTSQDDQLRDDDCHFLLAMALADKAIFGMNSVNDLREQQIPPGDKYLHLRWNDPALDKPVARKATLNLGVTDQPLTGCIFGRIFKGVQCLSGCFRLATIHALRRALGKVVDERYTEVQRSQHITQTDTRVFGRDYVANTSSVDGRNTFHKKPAQHDHIDYFQSFAAFREMSLPNKLPAEEKAAIELDAGLLELKDQADQLKHTAAPTSEINAAKGKVYYYRSKLTGMRLKKYKEEWVKSRRDWKITTRGKEQSDDDSKAELSELLSVVMPERGCFAKAMISNSLASNEERMQVIEDLYSLMTQDCSVLYRPGEKPANGVCLVKSCGRAITGLPESQRSSHIHQCCCAEMARTLDRMPSELKYYFICFDWVVKEKLNEHCQSHIDSISAKRLKPLNVERIYEYDVKNGRELLE